MLSAWTKRNVIPAVSILLIGLLCLLYFQREKNKNSAVSDDLETWRQHKSEDLLYKPVPDLMVSGTDSSAQVKDLSWSVMNNIKTFLFFVGHPRSGHSIVGTLLDAHPHIVMSHELKFFSWWSKLQSKDLKRKERKARLFNRIYKQNYEYSKPDGKIYNSQKGYSLAVESSWQGKYDRYISVIGDKGGGYMTNLYLDNETAMKKFYANLLRDIKIPLKSIYVIRNPYDIITSQLLYKVGKNTSMDARTFVLSIKKRANNKSPIKESDLFFNNFQEYFIKLEKVAKNLMKKVKTIEKFEKFFGKTNVFNVHLKDLVHHPEKTMKSITDFLEVESEESYLKMCADKIFKNISKTRNLIVWPEELKKMVDSEIQTTELMRGYTFESE